MSDEKDDNKKFREKCRLAVVILMKVYHPEDPKRTVELVEKYIDELSNREEYLNEN